MHELDVRLYDFKFSRAMKVIEKYYEEYFENLKEERDWDLYCQIYQPILYGHIKDIKSFKDFKDKVHPKQKVRFVLIADIQTQKRLVQKNTPIPSGKSF